MTTSPSLVTNKAIQAYFSHSYRAEDRDVNLFFWRLFSDQGFFFTIDPKSDRTFVTHLERMIQFSDCFIAVITRRLETKTSIRGVILPEPQVIWTHSPYIEFESRLSERTDKPRLIFVESGLDANLFGLSEDVLIFDRNTLEKRKEVYHSRVQEFADTVRDYIRYPHRLFQPTGKAGILINSDEYDSSYSEEVIELIKESLKAGGYAATLISPYIKDDRRFIRDLNDVELIVSEIREPYVTQTALSFIHAKSLPTIRICKLESGEERKDVKLPNLLIKGYEVGDIDPIITWRTHDDLVLEIMQHLRKFQQTRTLLGNFEEGKRYFMSAGRRPAKVFVSNAHTLNNLALGLIKGFQTFNIQFFHYQASLRIGTAWQEELKHELDECEIFVALVDDEYHISKWCQYELEHAFKRWENKQVTILPYLIGQTRIPELIKDYIQCAFIPNLETKEENEEVVKRVVETVDRYLTDTQKIPTPIRDRVNEFEYALDRTAIESESLNFPKVVEEAIDCLAKTLPIKRESLSSQLTYDMCWIDARFEKIFGDVPNFPYVIPFLFLRPPAVQHTDIDSLKRLLTEQHKRIVLVVFPPSIENIRNDFQHFKQILDTQISQIYACDMVLLSHRNLKSLVRTSSPNTAFKRMVLSQVNLPNYSPFVVTGPSPSRIFFGRERELRAICEHVRTTSYVVIGGRRIGKTSLLHRLHHVRLKAEGFRTIYHDCSTSLTYDTFRKKAIRDWQPEKPSNPPSTYGELLDSVPTDKPLVLLLDETDKLIPADRNDKWRMFNVLRSLTNSGLAHIILSGEHTLNEALNDSTSPLYNFGNKILLGPLDFHSVKELITQPMKQLEIELKDEKRIVKQIWAFTSGHPNVVQRLCDHLIKRHLQEQNIRFITLEDINAVIGDPDFQSSGFLSTYWESATALEKIISLLMADDKKNRNLHDVRQALEKRCGLQPKAREIDEALQRLTELRFILKRIPTGYTFAVEAFPRVVAEIITLNDMLEILVEEYQEKGK